MNDNGQFELEDETGIINISNLLDGIYDSKLKPLVYIKIIKNGKLIFEEDGGIFNHRDEQQVDSYFVCGNNLSKCLFYNTDEVLDITIKQRGNIRNYGRIS